MNGTNSAAADVILIDALRALGRAVQPAPVKARRDLLTAKQAAAYLKVTKNTFARLTAKGDIPQIKYEENSRPRYDPDDLDQYIASHKTGR